MSRRLVIKNSYGLEIWQDIPQYEGRYQASTLGRIKSLNYNHTGKEGILKPASDISDYLRVNLCKDGNVKQRLVHSLVAKTWLPSRCLDQTDVNHKDEDKTNNRVENLEYCSRVYNNNYGTRNQRVAEVLGRYVLQYNKEGNLIAEYPSTAEAERQTGINCGNISLCCNNKRKSAGGYIWLYN